MAFFGKPLSKNRIEIDTSSATADDPEILKRLERIEVNFEKFEKVFLDLESRHAIDDECGEIIDEQLMHRETRVKKPR